MNIEEQVIYKVIQVLQERTGLKGRWYARTGRKNVDGQIELKGDRHKYTFPVEFKREVKQIHFPQFQMIGKDEQENPR
ncbi:MAG: hypothetical protein EOO61_13465 [Hymenobacter sp.]|nr:MAG: hypothetical protein EOO61_13465 [Hymenobacter sp.]